MSMPTGKTRRNSSGQIVGTKGLTEQQATFCREIVTNGGKQTVAARRAGYSSPRQEAHRLLQLPHIIAAIRSLQASAFTPLASAALATLADIMTTRHTATDATGQPMLDPETGRPLKVWTYAPKLRLEAAKTSLDRAGHIAPKAAEAQDNRDAPMSEWSVERLEAFIRKGQAALAGAANPLIEGEAMPIDTPEQGQAFVMIEQSTT